MADNMNTWYLALDRALAELLRCTTESTKYSVAATRFLMFESSVYHQMRQALAGEFRAYAASHRAQAADARVEEALRATIAEKGSRSCTTGRSRPAAPNSTHSRRSRLLSVRRPLPYTCDRARPEGGAGSRPGVSGLSGPIHHMCAVVATETCAGSQKHGFSCARTHRKSVSPRGGQTAACLHPP